MLRHFRPSYPYAHELPHCFPEGRHSLQNKQKASLALEESRAGDEIGDTLWSVTDLAGTWTGGQ
jgi:hypothetical protein